LIDTALIIFIRNPEIGKGKTRIAQTAGTVEAYRIYLSLLESTKQLALSYPGPKYIFYSDFVDKNDSWDNSVFKKRVQVPGNLGLKMGDAIRKTLGHHSSAMVIGSDCPAMNLTDLLCASDMLNLYDLVIGPSEDGGYYLIGMNNLYSTLFDEIPWSSSSTYLHTIKAADEIGLSVHHLRTLNDIDTIEDWKRYLNR
jgi:rSAM/selenodomain-associated transferase 1